MNKIAELTALIKSPIYCSQINADFTSIIGAFSLDIAI